MDESDSDLLTETEYLKLMKHDVYSVRAKAAKSIPVKYLPQNDE